MLRKLINKLFIDRYLNEALLDTDRYDFSNNLGKAVQKKIKYDDCEFSYNFNLNYLLDTLENFLDLYKSYYYFIETEDQNSFKYVVWFLIYCAGFEEGYNLKTFNPKSNYYSNLSIMLKQVLVNPHKFHYEFAPRFDEIFEYLKILDKKLTRFEKRAEKSRLEWEEYQKTDEWKKIKKKSEKEVNKRIAKEEKISKQKYEQEYEQKLKRRKKILGITKEGPILHKDLNRAQKKIWRQWLMEEIEEGDKIFKQGKYKIKKVEK